MPGTNQPNIGRSLVLIHAAITRGISVGEERSSAFARAGFPDAATQSGFTDYALAFVSVLRAHHEGEDELGFPFLGKWVTDAPFDVLSADHKAMESVLEEAEAAVKGWQSGAQPRAGLADFSRAMTRLAKIWKPHIEIEEQHFSIPGLAQAIPLEEHVRMLQAFGKFNQEHATPDYLTVPFVLFNLAGGQRAAMAAAMPPVVTQQLVPVAWKDQWAPMKPFLLA